LDPRYDIQLDEDGDLIISNNDVEWGISDEQHIRDTINAYPGWWMENFSDGVGIRDFLNSSGQDQILARLIKIQLESDFYTVSSPAISFDSNGNLIIQPNAQ